VRILGVLALAGAASGLAARAEGQPFDHSAFDALLRAHVRDGMVDYDAFRKTPMRNWGLLALYAAGLPPHRLAGAWGRRTARGVRSPSKEVPLRPCG
jgi:hypothetical protein